MRVVTTAYGLPAYDRLRREVSALKAADPLLTVTLVVPTELVGVTARRALARDAGRGTPGVAALRVLTLRRLAESVSGTDLAGGGRRPLTSPALAAAVRGVLTRDPGLFAPVADHLGTVQALAAAHRTLRSVPGGTLDLLAVDENGDRDPLVADVVRIHRALEAGLSDAWFDGDDLVTSAVEQLPGRGWSGPVVGFLLQDLSPAEVELLAALDGVTDVALVRGVTGDSDADAGVLTPWLPDGRADESAQLVQHGAGASVVLHATDPDEEVRAVVGRVVQAISAGVPGHRVAVFYGSADPYARILHEQLADAGVTVHGRGVRPASERLLGRTLLRLMDLPRHDFRRNEVLAVLADGGVRPGGSRVPSTYWERLSRDAGVVEGSDAGSGEDGSVRDDWQRLAEWARLRRAEADAEEADPEPRGWWIARARRDADEAQALLAFVTDLRHRLRAVDEAATWAQATEALLGIWVDLLDGDDPAWPVDAAERQAATRVASVVRGLAGLDRVGGEPSLAAAREILELELVDDLGRVGTIGVGVHVGPLSDAVGSELDLVAVVGLAEGLTPRRHRDDPLLPDSARGRSGGALPTLRERVAVEHRRFLAAVASAPTRVLSFPRGDLRQGSERVPSRWLVPVLREVTGSRQVTATHWREQASQVPQAVVEVPSYAGSLERVGVLATEQQWRVRRLVAGVGPDRDPEFAADRRLSRSLALLRGRRGRAFTRFDGNLAGVAGLPDPTDRSKVSPTSLQAWVECPHAYLMRYVLGVQPVDDPEELLTISALDRGSALHEILERHVQEAIDAGPPAPDEPWSDAHRIRLDEIAADVLDAYEASGATGSPMLWARDRAAMLADARAFLDADDARRVELRLTPCATELPFGLDGQDPVSVPLGDGREVRLLGKADRVDVTDSGDLVVVDYKTGGTWKFQGLGPDDPTLGGRLLQLPVYGLAARRRFGDARTPVTAEYWFVTRRWRFERIGYALTDDVLAAATNVFAVIADGIHDGVFLARPVSHSHGWDCPYCSIAGTGDVERAWRTKTARPVGDASLAAYLDLVDPEPAP